jgi:4-hydroxy-tetrahydrodipicolinate reductase
VTAIAVHGVAGRMGRHILELVLAEPDARLSAALEHAGHAAVGADAGTLIGRAEPLGVSVGSDVASGLSNADVVIDFSLPQGTAALLAQARAVPTPAVVGTTGLDAAARKALDALAEVAPVVFAPNFSVGVNVLWALAERAVKLVGDDFDLEVIEIHHKHKVDAPSGTAVRLVEVAARARGLDPERATVAGRSGHVGARRRDEIGVHALRGGDVVGDHTLVLAGPGERLELTHRGQSREIYARGAVRAARWVVSQPAGLYDMADVLGIR